MRHVYAKIAGTAVLAVCAVFSAVRCADSFRHSAEPAAPVSFDGVQAEYVIRDWKGYVSVFAPEDREPVQITAIETDSLRKADQALLEVGLTVGSREQLLLLLEDLGT